MKSFLKKVLTVMVSAGTLIAIGVAVGVAVGYTHGASAEVVYKYKEVVKTIDPEFVVLNRIADCESGNGKAGSGTHYKNGQVVLKANTNGTIDIGKYQVNLTYWGKKASELKFDLTKEADNYEMARWIYLNKGTTDWSASQHCWYR